MTIKNNELISSVENLVFETEDKNIDHDPTLLGKAVTQWQFGDWKRLAKLPFETIFKHPDCGRLAILSASAHLQLGNSNSARKLIELAQQNKCSKEIIIQILVSGLHNSLGKASSILNYVEKAKKHFINSIKIGVPDGDSELIVEARMRNQLTNLYKSSETASLNNIMIGDNKINYIHYHKELFSYKWPAFILSYPRSGSNFLQNILRGSSHCFSSSIYAPRKGIKPQNNLTLKSHAFSLNYLKDEIARIVPTAKPSKLIIIYRDPRDVMISFYNFVKSMKKIEVTQEDFFNMSFYFATYMDKDMTFKRKTEFDALNIVDAYKRHVKNWFCSKYHGSDMLIVKYENMVNKPEKEFKRIFTYLELDCQLNMDQLGVKVVLSSSESNNRGVIARWKKEQAIYNTIIDKTNVLLKEEINTLGYK